MLSGNGDGVVTEKGRIAHNICQGVFAEWCHLGDSGGEEERPAYTRTPTFYSVKYSPLLSKREHLLCMSILMLFILHCVQGTVLKVYSALHSYGRLSS
jgi:hypothetical protein